MSTYKRANMAKSPSNYDNCPDFLERYLVNYLSSFSNKKPSTVIECCTTLREFLQFIHYKTRFHHIPETKDAHKDLDITCVTLEEVCIVSQDDIEEYLVFLETIVRNKSATLKKKLCLLREFYGYIANNADDLGVHLAHGDPVRYITAPRAELNTARPLSRSDVKRLMLGVSGETALRDRAIILLIATTALTLSQVVSLNRSSVDNGILTVQHSGKVRTIPLGAECQELLNEYLLESDNYFEGDSALFKSIDGKSRLTPRAIQLRITKAAANAGLQGMNVTAQSLRDTGAELILSSATPFQRRSLLRRLGYSFEYAEGRFPWLFQEQEEQEVDIKWN